MNALAKVNIQEVFGFGYYNSLGEGVSKLVAPAFSIASAMVVFYFLLGAFKYITSGGNKENLASAQNMITHAIIGFVILMFAFFVLQYLPQFFGFEGIRIF